MSKKEVKTKGSKHVKLKQQGEVEADRAAENVKRKVKQAKPQKRSHELEHEFH